MAELGLCINAKDAVPDAAECAALGLGSGRWLRTHIDGPLSLLDGMLATLPPDVHVMVSLNNQCWEVGWDWLGWEEACRIVAERYADRVKIVGAGNELDLWHLQPPVGEPDSRLTPGFAAELVRSAASILHPAGIKVAMSSVASGGWFEYLDEMARYCRGYADLADLHLYMKQINGVPDDPNWQPAWEAIVSARSLTGVPVICSEAGIKIDDAGGPNFQAAWAAGLGTLPADLVCYFAWSDGIGTAAEQGGQAFGARGPDGRAKPVWYTLQHLFGGPTIQLSVPIPGGDPMADRFVVGRGMRELMAQRGDQPAADELYFKGPDGKDEWSECMARSGRLYRYVFSLDKTFSFPPEVA